MDKETKIFPFLVVDKHTMSLGKKQITVSNNVNTMTVRHRSSRFGALIIFCQNSKIFNLNLREIYKKFNIIG